MYQHPRGSIGPHSGADEDHSTACMQSMCPQRRISELRWCPSRLEKAQGGIIRHSSRYTSCASPRHSAA
jgi:hypothetical protein